MAIATLEDGRFLVVNAALCAFYGLERRQILGRSSLELGFWADPAERERWVARLRAEKTVRGFEARARPPRGGERRVLISGEAYEFEGRPCVLQIVDDVTEERRATAALQASEQRFRLAVMTGDVWDADIASGTGLIPAQFKRALGYADDEIGNTVAAFAALVHPEDRALWRRSLEEHLRERKPYEFEFRARRKSGEYRWFATRGQASWDEHGRATYMAGTVFDITERKRAEDERLAALQRFEKVFLGAPEAMSISDLESGQFLHVNDAFCHMFGYPREALIGRTSLELDLWSSPARRDLVVGKVRAGEGVHAMEGQARTRTGELRETLFSADRLDFGGVPCLLLMFSDISERKRAEAALQESEARFRQLAENIDAVFWLTDPAKNTMLYVSPAYERIWGRSCASLYDSPRDWIEAIHPEDRERVLEAALTRQAAGAYDEEFRILRPDGSVRWVRDRAFPVRDAGGNLYRIAGVAQDVTLRKQGEAALRESEAKLRRLIDGTGPGIFIGLTTPQGVLIEANKPALAAGGLTTEDVLGKPLEQTYWLSWSEPVQQRVREAIARAAAGESVRFDLQIRMAEGRLAWIDFSLEPLRDAGGRVAFLVPSAMVIEERKRAEDALRENAERLRLFIEHAPSSIAMFDRDLRYIAYSRRWLADYGLGERDLHGRSHYEVFPDLPERWKEVHRRCLAGAVERAEADPFPRADGSTEWVRWEIRPWRAADGTVGGLILFSEVVTERKRAQDALREANQRLHALSMRLMEVQEAERAAIARELHDEIGQSLTALKLKAQIVAAKAEAAQAARLGELVAIADRTLAQTRGLTLDLRPPELDHLGLSASLREYVQRLRGSVEIAFSADEDYRALDRRVALSAFRVVQEALTNALRHAAAGRVAIALRTENASLAVEVADDGRGFDPAAARARALKGASMGLLGMEERATLAGGELRIDTAPGRGTRVRASFPLHPAAPA